MTSIFLDKTPVRVESPEAMKSFFLQVYGCQMNFYEAGVVREIMKQAGYTETRKERDAEILLMITCAVRSHAEQRALGRFGTFRGIKQAEPGRIIGVLGCMAQRLKKTLATGYGADLVIGPDQYRHLPQLIQAVRETGKPQVAVEQTGECYNEIFPEPHRPVCGFVTVMRGCNNFCSYCIVPYTRGRERSKSPGQVLAEAEKLATHGIKDITLLGQNVMAYHYQDHDFVSLLRKVHRVPGIKRIRFLTSHPNSSNEQIFAAMARMPKICPFLHLPLQSGSNRILKMMKRGYTREEYLTKIALARKYLPGLGLTTDIMVGFPSETEEDFQDTLEVIKTVRFDFAYMFRYSVRPGTAAVQFAPKVSEAEAGQRLTRLIDAQNRITRERTREMLNRTFELLIESHARGSGMLGRTRNNKAVIVHSPLSVGETVTCQITRIKGWTPVAEVQAAVALFQ